MNIFFSIFCSFLLEVVTSNVIPVDIFYFAFAEVSD